jgi:hypothetical protein
MMSAPVGTRCDNGQQRRTTTALLDWLRSTGISLVNLHATPEAEPIYRALGFQEPAHQALSLRLR